MCPLTYALLMALLIVVALGVAICAGTRDETSIPEWRCGVSKNSSRQRSSHPTFALKLKKSHRFRGWLI